MTGLSDRVRAVPPPPCCAMVVAPVVALVVDIEEEGNFPADPA